MTTLSIEVHPRTYQLLQEFADQRGTSLAEALELVVEGWRRRRLFQQATAAYSALVADPDAYAEWKAELAVWDVTLSDGLDFLGDETEDWQFHNHNMEEPASGEIGAG